MNGDEFIDALLVVLVRGEGVRGKRPPAVFVEKIPRWVFKGVETSTVAMSSDHSEMSRSKVFNPR